MKPQWKSVFGWALLAASFAPWAVYAGLPFAPLPGEAVAAVATGAFVFGQVTFVAGLLLLGRDTLARVKQRVGCPRGRAS